MKALLIAILLIASIMAQAQTKFTIHSVCIETENGDTLSRLSAKTTISICPNNLIFSFPDKKIKEIPIRFFGNVEYGNYLIYKTCTTLSGKTIFISPDEKWVKIDTGGNSTLYFSENTIGDPVVVGRPVWNILQSKEDYLQDSALAAKGIYQMIPENFNFIPYKP